MKNLANCKPSEFLKQTNRIKKAVEKWLSATEVLEIRKRIPDLIVITDDMGAAEKKKAALANRDKRQAQTMKNLSDMFDAVADKHPNETLELLALLCFVEPEDVDDHPVKEYIRSITEMLGDEDVMGFFTSFRRWGQLGTPD